MIARDTPPKCVGYTRVSSLDQAESGIGIEVQTERIKAYSLYRLKDYTWGGLYCDEAVSGATPFLKRPAGVELTKNIRRGDQIIISTLDRSFRTLREGEATITSWDDSGYGVHILDIGDGQAIDVRSASGRFFLQMMLAAAEFEYRRICERNKYAADKRRAKGLPIGRPAAPLGTYWTGRKGHKVLADDPHDMSIIRHIVKWHQAGWSLDHCWRTLWQQHVKTSAGKFWSRGRINNAYYGQMKILLKAGLMWINGYDDRGNKQLEWTSAEIRDRYFAGESVDSLTKLLQAWVVTKPESTIRLWSSCTMFCPQCNGRASWVSYHTTPDGTRRMERPCPYCDGLGIMNCCDGLQAQAASGDHHEQCNGDAGHDGEDAGRDGCGLQTDANGAARPAT